MEEFLLLEGLVSLLDEVGSGMSVWAIHYQLPQEINVEGVDPLRVGEDHSYMLGYCYL